MILDFKENPRSLQRLIIKISKEVENKNIDEAKINESVKKILIMKGYNIV